MSRRNYVGRNNPNYGKRHSLETRIKMSLAQKNRKKIYIFNSNYFQEVNTEEKAYWLGFLWGDGYLSKNTNELSLHLALKDKDHLGKFRNCIGHNSPIKDIEKTKSCRYRIVNKEVKNSLLKLGFNEREVPNCLNKDFLPHFLRGLFDSDGTICISKNKGCETYNLTFLGALNLLIYIRNILGADELKVRLVHKNFIISPIYSLSLQSKGRIISAYNFLYKDSTIFLDRKKEKFNLMVT